MTTANAGPPASEPSFTIELTLTEVNNASGMQAPSAQFRETPQYGRFECNDPAVDVDAGEWTSVADRLIASPVFDNGSFLWCDNYVEALLIAKVHRALGHTAYLLWDMAEDASGDLMGHVVLTSWTLPFDDEAAIEFPQE